MGFHEERWGARSLARTRRTNCSRSDRLWAQQSALRHAFRRCDLANSDEFGALLEGKAPYLFLYPFSRILVQSAHITVHDLHRLEHVTKLPRSNSDALRERNLILLLV